MTVAANALNAGGADTGEIHGTGADVEAIEMVAEIRIEAAESQQSESQRYWDPQSPVKASWRSQPRDLDS